MKNNQDVVDKVKSFLAEQLDRAANTFYEADSLLENGCDEFDVIELIMSLEDHFDISLEEEITGGMTIAGLAELVAYEANKSKK